MLGLQESLLLMIMTSKKSNLSYGPPPPITKLTLEQDLKLRQISDRLNSGEVEYKDIVTVFLALQKQNFVLANSMINLVKNWPNENHLSIETGERVPIQILIKE